MLAWLSAIAGAACVAGGIWLFNTAAVRATEWAPQLSAVAKLTWALRCGGIAAVAAGQLLFAIAVVPAVFRRGTLEQVYAIVAGVTVILAGVAAVSLAAATL